MGKLENERVVMKKLFIISVFFLIFTAQGKDGSFIQENVIECPSGFDMADDALVKKFGIKITKYKAQKSDNITKIYINANALLNGFPVPMVGKVHFQPAITLEKVSHYLTDIQKYLPSVATFKEGVLACKYKYGMDQDNVGQSLYFTIDTSKIGMVYQCPLRQNIKAIDKQETGVVKIKAYPQCDGVFAGQCSDYAVEAMVNRKCVHRNVTHPDYINVDTTDLPSLIVDPTAKNKTPMNYKAITLKGSDKVDTYQFRGRFGNLTLNSPSVQDSDTLMPLNKEDDKSHETFQVTHPDFLSQVNRGFDLDAEKRPIGHDGQLVMPPCRETHIAKIGGDKRIECLYSFGFDKKDATIMLTNKYNIDHDIKREKCTLWGAGYIGQNVKNLMEKDNKVSYVSLKPDGTFDAPPFMFCRY